MNEALVFALFWRIVLVVAVLAFLDLAFDEYREFHDARALRHFVAAITMSFGVIALIGTSTAIRDAWPEMTTALRITSGAGVFGFVAGIVFSGYAAWRVRQ